MLGLPKATELNKKLPKTAVYAKFQMDTAEKAKIDADISRITIVNEVSATKVNIAPGEKVQAFFVLQVVLKRREYNERTLIVLSKLIPQNMVLLLEYDGSQLSRTDFCAAALPLGWFLARCDAASRA